MILSAFADLRRIACASLALVSLGSAGLAHPISSNTPGFELTQAQQREVLFHSVSWKLAAANAPYCANTWTLLGLTLESPERLNAPPKVLSAAPQSPAERAGLRTGEEILAIDGANAEFEAMAAVSSQEQLPGLHRRIETLLEQNGAIMLTRENGAGESVEIVIEGQPVCPSRFLTREGKKIGADGVNVRFGLDFPGFAYPEDEFAAAVAHEFAHNLMGHPYWLDREGRKRSNVRMTEREADRLMPWLLANAGYDPSAARRFMERWGPRHGGGLLRKRTHDGWDERADLIDTEVALIKQLWNEEGAADWQAHFRREEGLVRAGL